MATSIMMADRIVEPCCELFSRKCRREDNDRVNKQREDLILELFNTDIVRQHPELRSIQEQFINIFKNNLPSNIVFDEFVVEKKGGRRHNYDFLVHAQKNLFTQHSIKVEFKHGKNIFQYPQILSVYEK